MRNSPEHYIQTVQDHFAQFPSSLAGDTVLKTATIGVSPTALLTTNQDGKDTAFQRWFHFKEAFSPSFVTAAINSLGYRPTHIIDPFGGSGTTAITAQLLGIDATTVEVNPFIADVIQAKVSILTAENLRRSAAEFHALLTQTPGDLSRLNHWPPTFIEAEEKKRWIFPEKIAMRLSQYLACIAAIEEVDIQRFFKVVLGSVLIDCSNVYVNGKGRRYRGGWKENESTAANLDEMFGKQFNIAFEDVLRFQNRPDAHIHVVHEDTRTALAKITRSADLIIFSPPYPNSFDYTDIYNVELWVLGYIGCSEENLNLRRNTLRSHVQISRVYEMPRHTSICLNNTIAALQLNRDRLWDSSIPAMVGAYFHDIEIVMNHCQRLLTKNGKVMMVVGDSRYVDVRIEVATIITEIARSMGFGKVSTREVRQMRVSSQQGGHLQLAESIVELGL